MKKLIKRTTIIVIILILTPFLYKLGLLYYMFYQEHKSAEIGRKNLEGQEAMAEMKTKIHEFATIIRSGKQYEDEGRYNLSIEKYKMALEMAKEQDDIWMAHCGLARAYKKSGQYELAIKEIDWIIAQNPRQEVKDEYIVRKQRIEELLKKENPTN